MPRSRQGLCIGLIAIVAAACAPEQERVYVDIDAVLARDRQAAAPFSPALPALSAFPPLHAQLPALPSRDLSLPVTRDRIDAAKALVHESEQAAFASLAQKLRDIRVAEIVRAGNARIEAMKPELTKARDSARAKAAALFRHTAPDRGTAIVRLALLVGFPDPDPLSARDFEPTSTRAKRRLEEARTWREIVRTIDADVDDEYARQDARAVDGYYKALAQVYDEIDEAKRVAEAEAAKEAQAQRAKAGSGIESLLAADSTARLPGVAGARVDAAGGQTPSSTLRVAPSEAGGEELARAKIESDLRVWAAVKGLVVTKAKGMARDATEDFISWRKTRRVGL